MGGFHLVSYQTAEGALLEPFATRCDPHPVYEIPLQTFQSFMQFKEIPRKLIVSKRLAQCLNPALPSGVHQRALDVYSHVLAVLGVRRLPLLLSCGSILKTNIVYSLKA
jgi:hypothetical protein